MNSIAAPADDDGLPQIPNYKVIKEIGKGAYGKVWLAKSIIGGFRAVKVVKREAFKEERDYEREFKALCKFGPISGTHPGLVAILHVGQNEKPRCFYYLMELADDARTGQTITAENYSTRTLKEEMANHPRLPLSAKLQIALSLTSAVGHIHEQGLIHRDIKPSNIIFVKGVPKIADIGLVTEAGPDVSQGGTFHYMPPEGAGAPTGDIYGLGKVFYELFMGLHPKQFPELPDAAQEFTSVPELLQVNNLILKACDQDPRRRFQTTRELYKALQAVAGTSQEKQPDTSATGANSDTGKPDVGTATKAVRLEDEADLSKSTRASKEHPAASGGQWRKVLLSRRTALIGLAGASTGGVIFALRSGPLFDGDPVVVLMDSPVDKAVYDKAVKGTGNTNAEELRKVLAHLPLGGTPQITISKESSARDWHGENDVIKLRPKLVLIHRSAFFHAANTILDIGYPPFEEPDVDKKQQRWEYIYGMSDEKLVCFMGHVATILPGTKFLIYSRGTDKNWQDQKFRDNWRTNCEFRFPALQGCVTTMLIAPCEIPGSENGSFKDPKTAGDVQARVKAILSLPKD